MTKSEFAGISALCLAVSAAILQGAAAQTPAKPRPFDRVPGILVACAPAPGVSWTEDICKHLVAEVYKRSMTSKLPVAMVENTSDMSSKKFGTMDSFDGDKAIRMNWICAESKTKKGEITIELKSNVIYEPSAKDFPNQPNIVVAPGQRIPMNFLAMQVIMDPKAKYSDAQEYTGRILDGFFEVGEGKL
jgi:hypothetical protein